VSGSDQEAAARPRPPGPPPGRVPILSIAYPMTSKLIPAALAATLLIGCATSPSERPSARLARLSLGMSKDEVSKILGPATQAATGTVYEGPTVQSGGFSEIHRYVRTYGGGADDFVVVFHRGKLTEYGPYVGSLRARYAVFETETR